MRKNLPYVALVAFLMGCGGDKRLSNDLDLIGEPEKLLGRTETTKQGGEQGTRESFRQGSIGVDLIEDLVFRRLRDGWTLTTPEAHVNVQKLRKAGVDVVFSAIQMNSGEETLKDLEKSLEIQRDLVSSAGGALQTVSSFKQALENKKRGIISVMVSLEGADALEGNVDRLGGLRKRGVGIVGLVAGRSNAFADAAVDPRDPGGVTEKGYELLEKCRDFKIVVDLTHASPNTFWDALRAQSGNVLVSHSAAGALREHRRNLDDLQILALARCGGVFGLVFNPDFLKAPRDGDATLDDVVRHIMHIKSIGAVHALALGTDYGGIRPPGRLEDISKLPELYHALKQQGLSDAEIVGIKGGNAAGLFSEVEKERGAIRLTEHEILEPVAIECESIAGEFQGSPGMVCDGYIARTVVTLQPTSRHRIRIKDMLKHPVSLEIFGQPNTPWQVEGQNLAGKVLFTRMVFLDKNGNGVLPLPAGRNLTRVFFSPTRRTMLREIVIWAN